MNSDEPTLADLHFGHLGERQIISVDGLKGKRIDPVKGISLEHWTGQAVIHFDDGKFAVLEIDTDYSDQQIAIMKTRPWARDLKYLDLVTEEEYDTYLADMKSRDEATAEEKRRMTYEKLKAEFEGDDHEQ